MPMQVCMGASMMCTFGMAPSSLVVLPTNKVLTNMMPDANIMDHIPMVNIMPFGMCMSPSNPSVGRRHRRGAGCAHSHALHSGNPRAVDSGRDHRPDRQLPGVDNASQLMCTWGGVITFVTPGEFTVMVP